MADRFRDFDAEYQASNPEQPPIQFMLGGYKYTCMQECPAGLLTDIMAATAGGDPNDPKAMAQAGAVGLDFFSKVLIPEDRTRMQVALHNETPGKVIPILSFVRALEWVIGEFWGKVSGQLGVSPALLSSNGIGSTAASPWPG